VVQVVLEQITSLLVVALDFATQLVASTSSLDHKPASVTHLDATTFLLDFVLDILP
jgi:hypothetical protein